MNPRLKRILLAGVVLIVVAFLVKAFGISIPGVDVAFLTLFGWLPFLHRVGTKLTVRWELVISAIIYAAIFIVGSHLFLRWVYREVNTNAGRPAWRARWTVSIFAIIVLMFSAGIGATGVVHQIGWLTHSPRPLYGYDPVRSGPRCAANLHEISVALLMYANEHAGQFPDDLPQLVRAFPDDPIAGILICPSSEDEAATGRTLEEIALTLKKPGHCSYIYLGKGMRTPVAPDRVVIVEPLENHDGAGINVLYGDGHVQFVERDAAEPLLLSLGFKRVEAPGYAR